jgi:hypothetical protein
MQAEARHSASRRQLLAIEDKGDFTGLGKFDAVEAPNYQVRIAVHPAIHQVGQLPQGTFAGHVRHTPQEKETIAGKSGCPLFSHGFLHPNEEGREYCTFLQS